MKEKDHVDLSMTGSAGSAATLSANFERKERLLIGQKFAATLSVNSERLERLLIGQKFKDQVNTVV